MGDDLFFIPMIAQALQQQESKAALQKTFEHIEIMGRESYYNHGYRLFLHWMGEVNNWRQLGSIENKLCKAFERPNIVGIIIEKDGRFFAVCNFDKFPGTKTVSGITAGNYRLKLDTGLEIWAQLITSQDIILSKAHPKKPFKMAAETDKIKREPPTQTAEIMGGALTVRFYAGAETGRMEIEIRRMEV